MFIYILIICSLIIIFLIRLIYVIKCSTDKHYRAISEADRIHSVKTMIILGSGGHTAEMINIVKGLNRNKYLPRQYIIAHTDKISQFKVLEIENEIKDDGDDGDGGGNKSYEIIKINRSRCVGQKYLTSIFTTLYSIICCIPIVYKCKPNLILCNGPGTCIPICLITLVFKIFYINITCKIIFIESFCRIKTLSLSGKILLYFCNEFIVQWPDLMKYSNRIKYFGRLS